MNTVDLLVTFTLPPPPRCCEDYGHEEWAREVVANCNKKRGACAYCSSRFVKREVDAIDQWP
jgi:hypothetical protein